MYSDTQRGLVAPLRRAVLARRSWKIRPCIFPPVADGGSRQRKREYSNLRVLVLSPEMCVVRSANSPNPLRDRRTLTGLRVNPPGRWIQVIRTMDGPYDRPGQDPWVSGTALVQDEGPATQGVLSFRTFSLDEQRTRYSPERRNPTSKSGNNKP